MPNFTKVFTQDPQINRIQAAIEKSFQQVTSVFDGISFIQSVSLVSGQDNVIPHKLSSQPTMWLLADQNTNTSVWRTAWSSSTITLRCGSNCIVSLLVR